MILKIAQRIQDRIILSLLSRYETIEGWLTPREAISLYRIAAALPRRAVIVEIGSWKGKSTYCLAKGLRNGRIFAIDPFDATGDEASMKIYETQKGSTPLYEQFSQKMRSLGVSGKIEPMMGYSKQFYDRFGNIDFLFIDGDHSKDGCDYDFTHYAPQVISGGYIAFHDYDSTRQELGPTWVVENRVKTSGLYEFVGLFDSLWVCKKMGSKS